jgi:hypothetical protein
VDRPEATNPRVHSARTRIRLATVAGCRVIVSWNFRHIVSFQKIPLYNGVNLTRGYGAIGFHTPQEVVLDEDEDV